LILAFLLGAAYLLPPTDVTQAPREWSWSYLNRQQAFGSPWEADEVGVGKGSVANGGWDRTRGGLLVVPKDQKWLRRHPIEVLMKVSLFASIEEGREGEFTSSPSVATLSSSPSSRKPGSKRNISRILGLVH